MRQSDCLKMRKNLSLMTYLFLSATLCLVPLISVATLDKLCLQNWTKYELTLSENDTGGGSGPASVTAPANSADKWGSYCFNLMNYQGYLNITYNHFPNLIGSVHIDDPLIGSAHFVGTPGGVYSNFQVRQIYPGGHHWVVTVCRAGTPCR